MKKMYKLPLVLEAQDEGGWTVTSPLVPELITEIDTIDEMDSRLQDAISAVVELYEEMGRSFPAEIHATRYPDEKLRFYRLCTKDFAAENFSRIKEIRKCHLQKIYQ